MRETSAENCVNLPLLGCDGLLASVGQMAEPENLVLELLRGIRQDISDKTSELKADISDVRSELHSLRADTASDMQALRKDFGDQIVGLRRAVVEYHSSVIGHGILISELEARVRRLENHLHLDEAS
jgi:chromosome segregation ATPase